MRREVRRACERAGLPVFTPYQLRHACAVRVQAACGWDATRAVLGHKSGGGVTTRYSGADLVAAATAMKKCG
jgi:integrase